MKRLAAHASRRDAPSPQEFDSVDMLCGESLKARESSTRAPTTSTSGEGRRRRGASACGEIEVIDVAEHRLPAALRRRLALNDAATDLTAPFGRTGDAH
jgi:hypothetical protein